MRCLLLLSNIVYLNKYSVLRGEHCAWSLTFSKCFSSKNESEKNTRMIQNGTNMPFEVTNTSTNPRKIRHGARGMPKGTEGSPELKLEKHWTTSSPKVRQTNVRSTWRMAYGVWRMAYGLFSKNGDTPLDLQCFLKAESSTHSECQQHSNTLNRCLCARGTVRIQMIYGKFPPWAMWVRLACKGRAPSSGHLYSDVALKHCVWSFFFFLLCNLSHIELRN